MVTITILSGNPLPPGMPLLTLPLAWRRVRPIATATVVAIGLPLTARYADPAVVLPILAAVLIAAGAAGLHGNPPWGGLVPLGIAVFADSNDQFRLPIPNVAMPLLLLATTWLIGVTLRRRTVATQLWQQKAELAEAQRATAEAQRAVVEAKQAAALAAERSRIARELHDVVTHRVTTMVLQAGAARTVLATQPDRAVTALLAVEASGRESLTELRGLLGVLAPATDAADGEVPLAPPAGAAALPALVAGVGLPARLTVTGPVRSLPSGPDLTVYRIVQEALTNAMRHSTRDGTTVAIHYGHSTVEVTVIDDSPVPTAHVHRAGAGICAGGRGLLNMRERAAVYGGTLVAGPGLDGRWRVRAILPLDSPLDRGQPEASA